MCVAAVILTWHSQNAAAQEKGDNAKLAKLVAETFAKEFIQDKNVEAAMKLTSVPFLQIEQGREQKPKRIEKSAGVQKQIQEIVKRHDEIGIRAKVTITKVNDVSGEVQLDKSTNEVFNAKSDRAFIIRFTQDGGFPFDLLTLVGWREGRPKVSDSGFFFSVRAGRTSF